MAEAIEINMSTEGGFAVLHVKGKIDAGSSPALMSELNSQISAGKTKIILDLAGVSFMSSAGIGATVKALNDLKTKQGDLRIAGAVSDVKKVYELLGFASVFRFYETVKEAAA